MKMKATGFESVYAMLRYNMDKIPDTARKHMHRGADQIVKEAKLNAPVDLHNLEESIHKEVGYEQRGRLKIDVIAGGSVNGVNVDNYIAEVHENYESMTPGPGTVAKRNANPGRHVGGHFLDRALETVRERLVARMIDAIEKAKWK